MKLLNYTWGIVQNIIGATAYAICRLQGKTTFNYNGAHCVCIQNKYGSVSLGNFIFGNVQDETTLKHEYGHTIQSAILGPAYLLVVGLPSFLWATFGDEYRKKNNKSYYEFYTESWADKLGGVKRTK